MEPLDAIVAYAISHVGVPYRWGGDDPLRGYDCSGFCQELLAAAGVDPPGDQTAQGLYDYFATRGKFLTSEQRGALVFYGRSFKKISHVAFAINRRQVIEAGGGGSRTRTGDDAADQNAYIRIRHVAKRKDKIAIIMPDYSGIGIMY